MKKLGKLTKVELRDYWINEASDFTPWLAMEENIQLLSDEIGIDLDVYGQEERVGPYRADILCKETTTDKFVLIENQLERTDHNHLGQLMTYAAGLDAVTIIWIAQRFTEEHRATLDWLNRISDEDINFFGIEIELYRIGESPAAPMFSIVSKPNDWSKAIKKTASAAKITPTKELQREYWQALKDHMESQGSFIRNQKPQPQHWTNFALGRSNFHLSAFANTRDNRIGVILVMVGAEATDRFNRLREKWEEASLNEVHPDLNWREIPNAKESHVILNLNTDPTIRADWPNQHKWLMQQLEKMHKFFAPKIKSL